MATQCPKCHQMLDEDYICCAGVEFQWKCTECSKRSRGLAMPFGQCPMCGGKLERVDIEDHPSKEGLYALQEALQLEVDSHLFYRHLAEAVDDPETSDFFESLSQMEKEHAYELSDKYHLHIEEDIFKDTGKPMPKPMFDDVCFFADTGDVSRLFDCAIGLEQRTLEFFEKRASAMSDGREKSLYLELAAEEREHIALLESQRDRGGSL